MDEMSERELMLGGEPYLASDPDLVAARLRARRLTRLYNATTEEEPERRLEILRELLGESGPLLEIEPPFCCDYGSNFRVGNGFYANYGLIVLDCNEVTIGRNMKAGPNVQLIAAYHPLDSATRSSGRELAAPIVIGDDVWLGAGVIVCPGVTIGSGTTIGAGSVVTRDIPSNVVAAGVPSRIIRRLLE